MQSHSQPEFPVHSHLRHSVSTSIEFSFDLMRVKKATLRRREVAMNARESKRRRLEQSMSPASSEEGERHGEVGELYSAVAVPTSIQQTWLKQGARVQQSTSKIAVSEVGVSDQASDTPQLPDNTSPTTPPSRVPLSSTTAICAISQHRQAEFPRAAPPPSVSSECPIQQSALEEHHRRLCRSSK